MKLVDLTTPLSIKTPPWPTYEPLQVKFFKRLVPMGANGQIITTSNHVGTHLDGELHFIASGRDIASIPLEDLYGPAAVADVSDIAEDYGIYTSRDITERVEVRERDILIIHTGYHHYSYERPEGDEVRYMVKHPGPTLEFAEWCKKMKIKWIGVDCGSADHPMNTKIREWAPVQAQEANEYMLRKYGKSLAEIFPPDHYQMMHTKLFPHGIIHVECLGGDIDQILNRRTVVGCFPWRFVDGESSICRVVAFVED
ncbi:MAG: cyclase family protein [Bacillota bacterium]